MNWDIVEGNWKQLKGLVISNMVWSVPEYNRYAEQHFINALPAEVLAELQAIEAAEDYGLRPLEWCKSRGL